MNLYIWNLIFFPLLIFVGTVDVISYRKLSKGFSLSGISKRLTQVAYNQRLKTGTKGFWVYNSIMLFVIFFFGSIPALLAAIFVVWTRNRLGKKAIELWIQEANPLEN